MKIVSFLLCLIFLPINLAYSNSEAHDPEITPRSEEPAPDNPDYFDSSTCTIDIYSWDEIYFRNPWIMDPEGNTFCAGKETIGKILKEKIFPDSVLCVNKHRDCRLTDREIRLWAEQFNAADIIIRPLPLHLERDNDKGLNRLFPIAI